MRYIALIAFLLGLAACSGSATIAIPQGSVSPSGGVTLNPNGSLTVSGNVSGNATATPAQVQNAASQLATEAAAAAKAK